MMLLDEGSILWIVGVSLLVLVSSELELLDVFSDDALDFGNTIWNNALLLISRIGDPSLLAVSATSGLGEVLVDFAALLVASGLDWFVESVLWAIWDAFSVVLWILLGVGLAWMAVTIDSELLLGVAGVLLASIIRGSGPVPFWAFECAVLGINDVLQVSWKVWHELVDGSSAVLASAVDGRAARAFSTIGVEVEVLAVQLTLGNRSAFSSRLESFFTEWVVHLAGSALLSLEDSLDLVRFSDGSHDLGNLGAARGSVAPSVS